MYIHRAKRSWGELSAGRKVLIRHAAWFVSDIAIFVLKRDVKLQLTNMRRGGGVRFTECPLVADCYAA